MTIKVCVAVTAEKIHDLRRMINKAERDKADIIEIRIDYLREKFNLGDIRKLTALPLIATNRLQNEGGFFQGSEEERISLLLDAAESGFDFVDIELMANNSRKIVARLKAFGTKTIVSHHTLQMTPSISKIIQIFKRAVDMGCDVCKIITEAKKIEDNLICLRFIIEASKTNDVVCFCMGELGRVSRLLSPLFGGLFTYASIGKWERSAIGQLTVVETKKFYELLGLDGK